MNPGILDITGATVIDGAGAAPLPNATLRIELGRIAALWPGGQRPRDAAPATATMNAAGKTVLPGLIDAHCHISYGEGRSAEEIDFYGGPEWGALRAAHDAAKVLRAGFTGISDPGSTWNVAVALRDAINSGMVPGPRIQAAGRHICADGAFDDFYPSWLGGPPSAQGVLCPTEADMVAEVRRQVKNRVDIVKISADSQAQDRNPAAGPCLTDEEFAAIVRMAHQLGRKVAVHARFGPTMRAAARAGADWLLHATYLGKDDVGFIRDSGIAICPTFTMNANVAAWGREVGADPGYVDAKRRDTEAGAESHRRAHEAGIPIMAGSESGFSVTPYGAMHARELELLVNLAGLTPMQAIQAATETNARVMGWDDVGTLAPGKRADVLIVDGNPLADISVLNELERIAAVYKDGVAVDLTPGTERTRMMHEKSLKLTGTWLERKRRGKRAEAAE
jgi:imidazolonepropionase-like amidohydrolase